MNKLVAIFGVLFIIVLGFSAMAQVRNPQIRACQQTGGIVHSLRLAAPVNDEVMFCQYGRVALVDAQSVMTTVNSRNYSMALKAYAGTSVSDSNTCLQSQGQIIQGMDLEGYAFLVCRFPDASAIEISTLSAGFNDSANRTLNMGLGL